MLSPTPEFRASGRVLLEAAEQTGSHHFTSPFADSATAHALLHRFDHHGYGRQFENALQFRRDLRRQMFLHLIQAAPHTSRRPRRSRTGQVRRVFTERNRERR